MMEYDKILTKIGEFGKYQKIIIVLVSASSIFNGLTSMAVNFIFGEHKHRCSIPGLDDHFGHSGNLFSNITGEIHNVTECMIEINGTMTKCDHWIYDKSVYTATIISKFDVVCDRKFDRAHFLTSHFVGLLVGSIIGGVVCDTIGRKPTLLIAFVFLGVAEGVRPFLPNFELVVIMEFFNGFGSITAILPTFILVTELVGPKKRLLAHSICYMNYCLSLFVVLLIAYIFRDWAHVMWIIAVLTILYMTVIFFLPESPRWLLSRGRKQEAFTILHKIAKSNGVERVLKIEDIIIKEDKHLPYLEFIKTVIRSKTLLIRLGIVGTSWFAISMTYYGLAMNIGKLAGNVFVNFAIASTADTVSVIMCSLLLDRIGHKKLYSFIMIIAGLSCISTMFTSMFGGDSLNWLTTTLAITGRFFISAAFFTIYLYTAELFPTALRASVVGLSSMFGRVGTIVSAYVGELGSVIHTKFGTALPILIFGGLGLIAGILSILLPDTTALSLPESVRDAKRIKRKDRDLDVCDNELVSLKQNN